MKRALLLLAGLLLASAPGRPAVAQVGPERRVVVVSLDGLRPDEVVPTFMPNVSELRQASTWYEASRSVMIAETIPNHVAMMTGVHPDRSGIPANDFWDREGTPESQDLELPAEIEVPTLFTTLAAACPDLSTAAVLSKRYLFNVFSTGGTNVAPDSHWNPQPLVADDFAPAVSVALEVDRVLATDVDLLFVNFGDIDRGGHVDVTGPVAGTSAALRTAAKVEVDAIFGSLVDDLAADPRWPNTVVIVLSDHGFDWSPVDAFVNPQAVVDGIPALAGKLFTVTAGGVAPMYLLEPAAPDADAVLAAARAALLPVEGVDEVWITRPNAVDPAGVVPDELHLDHPNAGDLVVLPEAGYRTSSPSSTSNPLPGNHGHFATRQGTFMVGGGLTTLAAPSSVVASSPDPTNHLTLPEQSETIDVAPTVAWLYGLDTSGYDGRVLREAFSAAAAPEPCRPVAAPAPSSTAPATTAAPGRGGGVLPETGGRGPAVGLVLAAAGLAVVALRRAR